MMLPNLHNYLHLSPDGKGRIYPTCPYCGKESSHKNVHTLLDDKGYKCFVCGKRVSLFTFAKDVGLIGDDPLPELPERPEPIKPEPAKWLSEGEYWLSKWENLERFEQWNRYKPLMKKTIEDYRLGYGNLPDYSSRCTHNRLIVPLITDKLVGVRARWSGCECDPHRTKWLSPKDSQMVLYNGAMLGSGMMLGISVQKWKPNSVLYIVENPIDCLMMVENGIYAVATLGVTIWQEDWTRVIKAAKPDIVIVVYDHDLAGNGGSTESEYEYMVKLWKEKNPQAQTPPVPNGIRLVNNLNDAGIFAKLYHWPVGTPLKADIGDLLKIGA